LFEFELLPVDEIIPWGTAPDLSLHWFGLTDGFYRLKVGDEYLLNYTNEVVGHWKQKHPDWNFGNKSTWIDYQVVRLWEDVLDILPYVLEPLPQRFVAVIDKGVSDLKRWEVEIASQLQNYDAVWEATSWIGQRSLDTMYLNPGASIKLWSADDIVYIKWDNVARVNDGIPVWSARRGVHRMRAADFLQEVHSFHDRLMQAMEARVAEIISNWRNPSIHIDLKHLAQEQKDRKTWLDRALAKPRSSPELETAIKLLSPLL
jgi:hypothetical protein